MFNVCPACGLYDVDKAIDPGGPFAICPHCGHAHRFVRLPLAVISGPSGAGKSTVCLALAAALFGSVTPAQIEACSERRYFSAVRYLALVCDDDALRERLRARPAWRKAADPEWIEQMVAFNRWFKTHAAASARDHAAGHRRALAGRGCAVAADQRIRA